MSYSRKLHIAHRDVRTDNLLLSRSGVLKLCGGCGVHGCIRSLTFFFNSGLFYAACSPPESPKHSDTEGIVYWQAPEMYPCDPLKIDCGRSALRRGSWRTATCLSRTYRTCSSSLTTSSCLCPRQRAYHDPFTIYYIGVLTLLLLDRTQTSCSTTACPHSDIFRPCKAIDEERLLGQNDVSICKSIKLPSGMHSEAEVRERSKKGSS